METELKRCPVCGAQVPSYVNVCPECKSELVNGFRRCEKCGERLSPMATQCTMCGATFPSEYSELKEKIKALEEKLKEVEAEAAEEKEMSEVWRTNWSHEHEDHKKLKKAHKELNEEYEKLLKEYNELVDEYNDLAKKTSRSSSSSSTSSSSRASSGNEYVDVKVSYLYKSKLLSSLERSETKIVRMTRREYKALLNGSMKARVAYVENNVDTEPYLHTILSAAVELA